jgi:hypothetical protein
MSALQDLAANLRAGTSQLPVDIAIAAADRFVVAAELLAWVRRTSPHPMGVPQLAGAVEHLEHSVSALRAAQDGLEAYLAALGLAPVPPGPATGQVARRVDIGDEAQRPDSERQRVVPLRRWWSARVDELTTDPDSGGAGNSGATGGAGDAAAQRREQGATDPVTLLRSVARGVRGDDRGALRDDLRRADAPVGLGLSAVTPTVLRRLVTDLLGRSPRPEDVDRLRELTGPRVRQLLPGMPATVPETLIERICQVPPDQRRVRRERGQAAQDAERRDRERRERAGAERAGAERGQPRREEPERVDHPADSAVAGAVLVGILAQRLGREPDALARDDDRRGPGNPDA